MATSLLVPSFENDRSGFGSLLSSSKKHRARAGEKSISGVSFTSRGLDDISGSTSVGAFGRPNRRRNLSTASTSLQSILGPLLVNRFKGSGESGRGASSEVEKSSTTSTLGPSKMTRSASMRDAKAPAIELNNASLHHVRRMLHQLLEDANIPNVASWEKGPDSNTAAMHR